MDLIENELTILKKKIENSFVDPIPNEALNKFVSKGSKLVRSSLAILYFKAQNFEISEKVYNILSAGEIIHNASLLHDDVIDNANLRRGEKTLSKQFSPHVSILAGDYLLSYAIEKLLSLKDFKILDIFKNCIRMMSEAEIKQYFLREKITTENDYIEICKGKTASLFSVIMEACSIILEANDDSAKIFGEYFGICFQIKNDLDNESAMQDKYNAIYTAKDVLGIEKTQNLLDNYKEEMSKLIEGFPDNIYKERLKDLINSL